MHLSHFVLPQKRLAAHCPIMRERESATDSTYDLPLGATLEGALLPFRKCTDADARLSTVSSQKHHMSMCNTKYVVFSFAQMVAHHSRGGCPLRPGDLLPTLHKLVLPSSGSSISSVPKARKGYVEGGRRARIWVSEMARYKAPQLQRCRRGALLIALLIKLLEISHCRLLHHETPCLRSRLPSDSWEASLTSDRTWLPTISATLVIALISRQFQFPEARTWNSI